MKIVLLESLGVKDEVLEGYAQNLKAEGHEFQAYGRDMDAAVQIERAKDADVIMIANMPSKGEVIRTCKNLKFVDVALTGADHVGLEAAKEDGVAVSNASGYSNESMAELVIGMTLSLLRNVPQVDTRCREGKTKDGLIGRELASKTVGIIRIGAIGSQVAELYHAFGCKILAYDLYPKKDTPEYLHYVEMEELLASSGIVTLHCPLTSGSIGLTNQETIGKMKKGAILINASRGLVVDLEVLVKMLHEGTVGGAGIDVFETEPPLNTDHPLLHTPNTIVTPHIAFASEKSMELRAKIVFESLEPRMDEKQGNIIL